MEVHTTPMAPSSQNAQHLVGVCPEHNCGALLWPGLSKSDICDHCSARVGAHNALTNPRDATRIYASRVENVSNESKEAISVAPAVLESVTYSAPPLKYPPLPPYLLPISQLENTYNYETEISNKQLERDSTSVSYQGRQSVNLPGSTISVPLYNYYGPHHKRFQLNISSLTEEPNQTQHRPCEICRAVMPLCYSESICPTCRFGAAPSFKEIGFDQRDCFSKPKEILSESNVDDLSTAVMSIFSNPDEIIDDANDIDMEGIELSYPEVMDNGIVEEPQLQLAQESSSRLKGNLPPENVPHAITFPKPKQSPRNSLRSFKLCSRTGCTGIISSESPATRCLGCVRKDWRSKINGHVKHNIDDGRLSSGIIKRSISTKQKTKKVVTWADEEASHLPASQKSDKRLECDPSIEQQQRITPSMDSNSVHGISPGRSADMPLAIDEDPQVDLNIQVGKLPSSPETRAPSKRHSKSPIIRLSDPTTGPKGSHEDSHIFSRAQELSASVSSNLIDPVSEATIFGWGSDLSDLSDDNESEEDVSSSGSPEAPLLLAPTGLKIRIPPRPGLYVRKCGSIRCQQRLPAIYRWKSCVMCRAQSRKHQQNLQGRSQIIGTPLSRDVFNDDSPLVAGARLCSVHSCTYIIPPSNEYRWKMCALCRIRAKSNQTLEDASTSPHQDETISQKFNSTTKIAERLPKRDKQLPGRCQSLDCGMLLSGTESTPDCDQCITRSSWFIKFRAPSPYPQYKAFPTLLADLKIRFNDFLQTQLAFFLHNAEDSRFNSAKAIFVFNAEYSIVALDFDIVGRKEAVDDSVLKLKGEIERISRLRFSPKRYISILEGGGIAERFFCLNQVPLLQAVSSQDVSAATYMKNMHSELEIAVVPDHSHPFIPGQRTIVRFRLLG